MAQLFDIKKVTVGPKNLEAIVELAANAPVMTSEDLEGTTRVWQVMPELRDHVCLGDESGTFGDVMGDTELAHLLEHVTVELLARTDVAGDIACGQTSEVDERTYKIVLKCIDDVLVVGALSSASWIMQWAFSGGGEPVPDVDAIAKGLVELVGSLPEVEKKDEPQEPATEPEPVEEQEAPSEVAAEDEISEPEPAAPVIDEAEVDAIMAAEPPAAPEPESEPAEVAESEPEPAEPEPEVVEEVQPEEGPAAEELAPEPELEPEPESEPADEELAAEPVATPTEEPTPAEEVAEDPASEPEEVAVPTEEPAPVDDWGMGDVPRPRLVR